MSDSNAEGIFRGCRAYEQSLRHLYESMNTERLREVLEENRPTGPLSAVAYYLNPARMARHSVAEAVMQERVSSGLESVVV